MKKVFNFSILIHNVVCPSELGIVFKNHLKFLAQHDVSSGLQSATKECLERREEKKSARLYHVIFHFFFKKITGHAEYN